MVPEGTVFIVDPLQASRESLSRLLESIGLTTAAYPNAEVFLDRHDRDRPGCMVVDIRMPGMSGIELQERLVTERRATPVIILSAHGDIETAVRAMQNGAIDFIERPYDVTRLLNGIRRALEIDAQTRARQARRAKVHDRMASLTPREREVMTLLASGQSTKQIAFGLGVCRKTVDVHRAHVMTKLGVHSLIELARMSQISGTEAWPARVPPHSRSASADHF